MILKYASIPVVSPDGTRNVWTIDPGVGLEKNAGYEVLPQVDSFIKSLSHRDDGFYVLVNAMGAGEYWGSNLNGDFFPEAALCHEGSDYGYRTFYSAHVYKHHANKDPAKSFGDVVFAAWNRKMHRVELVLFVDKERSELLGATDIYDKINAGDFMAVSMGCKVKYDLCSICLDRKKYQQAKESYNPMIHASVEDAVLAFHKKNPIKGLARTRKDYCIHAKTMMNKIFPDGRKVYVINDFPKFFDISFVYIGADKTARVMKIIKSPGPEMKKQAHIVSTNVDTIGRDDMGKILEKVASVPVDKSRIKEAEFGPSSLGRGGLEKMSSILKNITSEYVRKIVPAMERSTKPLPEELIEHFERIGLPKALGMSIRHQFLFRPDEFQRMVLTHRGMGHRARELFDRGEVFAPSEGMLRCPVDFKGIPDGPADRPPIEQLASRMWRPDVMVRRVVIIRKARPVLNVDLDESPFGFGLGRGGFFDDISRMYNAYRQQVFDLRPRFPEGRLGIGPMVMMSRMFGPTTRRQRLVIKMLLMKPSTIYDIG